MRTLSALLLIAALGGCSTVAPKFNSNFDDVARLRDAGLAPITVGAVTKLPGAKSDVDKLTIRAGSFNSPYGSYTAYLKEALRQELDDARLLAPTADTELSAVLLRNEIAAEVSVGWAEIEAHFVVKRGGAVRYDRVKSARFEWPSSFVGMVAIPAANQNYQVAMHKLITALFQDPDFIAALKN